MSALVLILLAFSQNFYTEFQGTDVCATSDGNSDFCSMSDSYLKVYAMMYTSDMSQFTSNTGKLLYIMFTFTVVIALLNILIGIVCNAYDNAVTDGSSAFWMNKLDTVDEFDGLKETICNILGPFTSCISDQSKSKSNVKSLQLGEGRAIWDIMMVSGVGCLHGFSCVLIIIC